ncbi:MAG: rRNA maturation RNase YbeY [bacterium]
MKLLLEINNQTLYKFPKKIFTDVFAWTIEKAAMKCLAEKNLELSIAIVSEVEIHTLNKQYRKKDKPTDVLSFCEFSDKDEFCACIDEKIFLGELILCPAYIEKNAKEDGESLEFAISYITSHGILHLLGFDHGKKMFSLQNEVAQKSINNNLI